MVELEKTLFKTASQIEVTLNTSFQKSFGITFSEFLILFKLYQDKESTIAAIQKDIQYKMDSASIKTKKLRELDYLKKERRQDDERKVCVVLTEKGIEIVETILSVYSKKTTNGTKKFSTEDMQQLISLLDRFRTSMIYKITEDDIRRSAY